MLVMVRERRMRMVPSSSSCSSIGGTDDGLLERVSVRGGWEEDIFDDAVCGVWMK